MIWHGVIGSAVLLLMAASCSPPNRLAPSNSEPYPSDGSETPAAPTVDSPAGGCLDASGQDCIWGTDEMFQDHTDPLGDGQHNHNTQRLLATFWLRPAGSGKLEGVAIIEHTLTGDFEIFGVCSGTYEIEPRRYEAKLSGEFNKMPGTDQVYLSFIADPLQGPPPIPIWKDNCDVTHDLMPYVWEWSGFGGALTHGIYDFAADWSAPDVGEFWQKVHMEQSGLP